MSIVAMKKLRLIAVRSQKEAILQDLMLLGCVEVSEPAAEPPEELSRLRRGSGEAAMERHAEQTKILNALRVLDQYAPYKRGLLEPRPEVSRDRFLDEEALAMDLATADHILALDGEIRSVNARESRERAALESLQPWKDMDLDLAFKGTKTCDLLLGALPAAVTAMEAEGALAELAADVTEISVDNSDRYIAVLYRRELRDEVLAALRGLNFSQVTLSGMTGTARENIRLTEERLQALAAEKAEKVELLAAESGERLALQTSADALNGLITKEEAAERLLNSESTFYFEGWTTAPEVSKLTQTLEKYDCAWELSDPEPDEYADVPVQLRNSKLIAPMNMVTNMYALPAYDGVDPNPLMWFFFILFYGMMMADMGYGLVMIIIALLAIKKAKPRGPTVRYMFPLMGLCGITTFAFGAATSGFFGDFVPQLVGVIRGTPLEYWPWKPLINPLQDAVSILLGALALGVCQIFTGMAISMLHKFKKGQTLDAVFGEITWYVILIGAVLAILKISPIVLILGGVLLLAGSAYGAAQATKSPVGIVVKTVTGLIGTIYNSVSGYFSDILSYSRLMALMLAGAVIAQVFNTLGAMTGNVVLYIIIAMVGNGLNFALNILGCFVHDMRLQCLEFFGRFYEDGGREFRPVGISTNYIDIV
ncbi:MAG: V-type ATP synthase subunit I [Oscillospiraceae bacterium]|nr:V-type ATP synthase subunit I [Oscillospiraceae bacterium]